MARPDLEHRFAYHPPRNAVTVCKHEEIRSEMLRAALVVEETCPEGREKSLAITKLEEAMMWANAAIARAQGSP